MKPTLALLIMAVSQYSLAAADTVVAKKLAEPNYSQSVGSMLFGLVVVITVLLVMVWLSKKAGMGQFSNNNLLSVKSHLALSQKEKLVVVEYQGKQILLGVAPGCVNCIDIGDIEQKKVEDSVDNSSFAARLMSVIKDKSSVSKHGETDLDSKER